MTKVIMLSSDNINAQTGAAKFVRLFTSKAKKWKENEIEVLCFSNSGSFSDEMKYRKTASFKFKQIAKRMLFATKIGRRISLIRYQLHTLGNLPIVNASNIIDKDSVVILNDIRVAYNYYNKYQNNYKSIFIMHNSGDMLSMLKEEMVDRKVKELLEECEKNILKYADALVFVSEVARSNFNALHPEYNNKTKTIYIGMEDTNVIHEKINNSIGIVTIGTVCDRKNQILVIKAVENIVSRNIKLTIVGGGPKLYEWKKYVKDRNLGDKVFFAGASDQVDKILAENDMFVMTSKDEGLPVAAQEAMSFGMPLILTDVGGCQELICENGFLINPKLEEVIEAINYYIDNSESIRIHGNQSKALFKERFSLEKMTERYIELVKDIINLNG
ncbi:glycosyltransferase family 4 protein [Bacteroides caecimuris]|uniref:glycosyltransferase family 4 protein n=1 Tax=Bacteroides caecimuris TaxID=1796613 RepID=UPI002572F88E|nr:glycosyltransferase family 4 protein [Bacteroides caecimuris]